MPRPMAVPQKTLIVALTMMIILAAAAALVLTGGTPVGAEAQTAPTHAQPEGCLPTISPSPSSPPGRLALFDVYWDADDGALVNNPCPPTVTITREAEMDEDNEPTGRYIDTYTRAQSTVDIDSTIIHVPNKYKHTLSLTSTTEQAAYPFMFLDKLDANGQPYPPNTADNAKDGVADTLLSDEIWVLPDCKPGTTTAADDLCLIFSAALLNPSEWTVSEQGSNQGPVVYHFEHESDKYVGEHAGAPAHALVFYPTGSVPTGEEQVTWSTDNPDTKALEVTPGAYEHRNWGFTERGTHVFTVHAKGHPSDHETYGRTVTSVAHQYIFHVGLLAELTVDVSADDQTPDVGDTVTLTVSAQNDGPSIGNDTKVTMELPQGLTYVSSTTVTGSYDSATSIWSLGNMAAPDNMTGPTTATLTITATVADGTRGKPLEVTATIGATEVIDGHTVDELDPHAVHHSASVVITPTAVANAPAELYLELSVPENSDAETEIGDVIKVRGVDTGDENTLTYTLYNPTDHGSTIFTTMEATGGVQIVVAPGGVLDFEHGDTVYDYDLQVSDGKDEYGNEDPSIDSSIPVQINITDVRFERFNVTLEVSDTEPTVGDSSVIFTITLANHSDADLAELTWKWTESHYNPDRGGPAHVYEETGTGNPGSTRSPYVMPTTDDSVTYTLSFWRQVDGQEQELARSNGVTVNWQER